MLFFLEDLNIIYVCVWTIMKCDGCDVLSWGVMSSEWLNNEWNGMWIGWILKYNKVLVDNLGHPGIGKTLLKF
jgi:hypothetical protein